MALGLFGVLVLGTSGIAQAQPQEIGQWETRPEFMPINPVHTGLLRTGKVLVIAGSGNDRRQRLERGTPDELARDAAELSACPFNTPGRFVFLGLAALIHSASTL